MAQNTADDDLTIIAKKRTRHTPIRLVTGKAFDELTDDEHELAQKVCTEDNIPEGAEDGDTFTASELLEGTDARTEEEKALDEAREHGEEVEITSWSESCDGSEHGCSTDIVKRVATPSGGIENRRTHTY